MEEVRLMNEHDKALSIIGALANGADPTSGELLPAASPYNNPGVIRALFFALNNLEQQQTETWKPRSKKTTEERQQDNLANGRPRNAGLPWDDETREYAATHFRKGAKIEDIATKLERSNIAIIAGLKQQGVISAEEAMSLSGDSQNRIAPYLNSR
jgi:hypothetical protein